MSIQTWLRDPMNKDMTADESAVYALSHQKSKEGKTAST